MTEKKNDPGSFFAKGPGIRIMSVLGDRPSSLPAAAAALGNVCEAVAVRVWVREGVADRERVRVGVRVRVAEAVPVWVGVGEAVAGGPGRRAAPQPSHPQPATSLAEGWGL